MPLLDNHHCTILANVFRNVVSLFIKKEATMTDDIQRRLNRNPTIVNNVKLTLLVVTIDNQFKIFS